MALLAASLPALLKAQNSFRSVSAGPFSLTVPEAWAATSVVEEVPLRPVYSPEDWKAFRADSANALKPDYGNRPHHWALRFPAATPAGVTVDAAEAHHDPVAPQVLIHKAGEWGRAMTDGRHDEASPDGIVKDLRARLAAAKAGEAPVSPAFMDASLDFVCLRQPIQFQGGSGIRFVAQWTIEPSLVSLGELHYQFLGLSDDGTSQIIATFPLVLPELAKADASSEHLGRSIAKYEELSQGYAAYAKDATKWLEERAGQFTPRLETLDSAMASLVAKAWK